MIGRLLRGGFMTAIYAYLYIPIIILIVNSFNSSRFGINWQGFTTKWYSLLMNNDSLLQAAQHSLTMAVFSATFATLIGSLTAVALYRYRFRGKPFVSGMLFVVMMSPDIVMAISLLVLFMLLGIQLGFWSLFGLVGYAFRQKRSLEASIKYTILSAAASSFLLFGMALVYAQSGDLSFVALGKNLGDGMLNEPLLLAGFGLMIVGLGFKLSLVPFHLWTPDVYQGAPAPVSTFLATASKIAIFGVVMRLFLYAPVGDSEAIRVVLAIIAFASIIFGNLMALSQTNIKRLLGYSSISHLGYLLVALIALQTGEMSMEAVGVYLAGYLFSSLGAFGVVSLMSSPYRGPDADSLFSYRGLFWHRPILAAVMTVMMLSLAGIPMTLGFIGKFYVLAVGVQAHLWWLVGAVVVGSAIGLYYYLRVAVSLYLHAPEQPGRDAPSNWQYSAGGIVVLISALLVLVLGVWPQPLISIVRLAMPLM